MPMTINFLPWRETRQRQRRRLGLLFAAGLLLVLLAALAAFRAGQLAERTLDALRTAAAEQLNAALSLRERAMQAQWQEYEARRQRQQRRALTQGWQTTLPMLAGLLPEQAWLTRLEYRQNALSLSGLVLNLNALAALEKALTAVPGFRPARAGETQRDAQGRWRFHFTLAGERADAGGH